MKSTILYNIPDGATPIDFKRIAKRLHLIPFLTPINGKFNSFATGHLYITARQITSSDQAGPLSYISFITAAIEFNNAIKRTPWSRKNPPCVGEWNASSHGVGTSKRWWNGEWWSVAYTDQDSEEKKQFSRQQKALWNVKQIEWRGLTEQPITAGFLNEN